MATCNDENAALDLNVLKDECGQDLIFFLDNSGGPHAGETRRMVFAAAVAKDDRSTKEIFKGGV